MGCATFKKRLRGTSFPIFHTRWLRDSLLFLMIFFEVHSLRAQNITHCNKNVHTNMCVTIISSNQFHIRSRSHVKTRALY